MSDERYSDDGYALLAPITTTEDAHCLIIGKEDADCAFTGGSGVRCDMIVRLKNEQVVQRLGRVRREFYDELVKRMMLLIMRKTTGILPCSPF